MIQTSRVIEGDWYKGLIPENVEVDETAYIETSFCFHKFKSQLTKAATFGKGASAYRQTILDTGKSGYISVGDFSMLNNMQIISDRRVEIGAYCLFSWNVVIMDTRRAPTTLSARRALLEQAILNKMAWPDSPIEAQPVTIGDNVWIGFDSVVLPGVRIGRDSVIGARSVVTEDIPERSIAVGSPARVIRTIHEKV